MVREITIRRNRLENNFVPISSSSQNVAAFD